MKSYWIYVLQSESTGKIYIGQTEDLKQRVIQHNDADSFKSRHTYRNRGPWKLVYNEEYQTREEARLREDELKGAKGRTWLKSFIVASKKIERRRFTPR
jgi:putative endonuclease